MRKAVLVGCEASVRGVDMLVVTISESEVGEYNSKGGV